MKKANKLFILFVFMLSFSIITSSCSTIETTSRSGGLPILSQDELIRPYKKLGRIQVTRETYGSDNLLSPDLTVWGFAVLRQEAEKMGADAVILPEVTTHTTTYGIIPTTEYRATGFAIKFK